LTLADAAAQVEGMSPRPDDAPPRPVDAATTADAALRALEGGAPVVAAVAIGARQDAPGPRAGRRMLIWRDGERGSLGDADADDAVIVAARALLEGGTERETLRLPGGEEVLMEAYRPPHELVIVGAGHIAIPLAEMGRLLGMRVTVLDDRPDFADASRFPAASRVLRVDFSDPFAEVPLGPGTHLVLVTRGHRYDYDALRSALDRSAGIGYIGMIGSQRRVRATFEQLRREGVPADRLRAIHAPIGLDLGAETPAEIAVAVAAEIVLRRRGGTGRPLSERARVVDRWIDAPPAASDA
jgi:xanthine dehydrogenase accessory factor